MKLMKSLTWLLVMLLAIGMVGCSDDDDDDDPTGPTTTDHFEAVFNAGDAYYSEGTKNITAATLFEDINNDEDLFIIDYRSADDFANLGHIEGAVNWPLTSLIDNLGDIPSGAKVVNVCYTGQFASQATGALRILGYDAWNLKFGMSGWTTENNINAPWANLQEGGQELVTEATVPTATYEHPVLDYDAADATDAFMHYVGEYLAGGPHNISTADVYANLNDDDPANDPFILNYWPPDMYDQGHIPGAVQGKPITMDLLSHIPEDQQVVVYCHTGQTSSQIVPWLNALGYDAYSMLFGVNSIDQSFPDLVAYHAPDTDYPIVTGN